MFQSDIEVLHLEQICQQLQEKLTQTYSQFGQKAGCQLTIIPTDY